MGVRQKPVRVTGGAGLGRHVVQGLRERGCGEIVVPRRSQYDLTREGVVARLHREARPDVVIHLAAAVGGDRREPDDPGPLLRPQGAELLERTGLPRSSKLLTPDEAQGVVQGALGAMPR